MSTAVPESSDSVLSILIRRAVLCTRQLVRIRIRIRIACVCVREKERRGGEGGSANQTSNHRAQQN